MNNSSAPSNSFRPFSLVARLILPFTLAASLSTFAPTNAVKAQSTVPGGVNTQGQRLNAAATPASDSVLHLIIGMNGIKRTERDAYLKAQYTPSSPLYRKWLTPEQYGEKFGASPQDVQAVVAYAKSQGFTVTKVWPNNSLLLPTPP